MAQNKSKDRNSETNEVKSLIRALEDRRDSRIQTSIKKEYLLRDLAAFKEKVDIELKHNSNLKLKLQQLKEINEREREKHELMSSILSIFAKGNLNRVLSFSADQVEKYKKVTSTKQVEFEKKLKEHIDDHTKKNPLFLQYQEKQAHLAQLEQQLDSLREERNGYIEKTQNEKQVNNLLFQQNIIEMAQQFLRYCAATEKLKNPTKNIRKTTPLKPMMAKMTMSKRVLDKSSEPMIVSNENQINDQNMPAASSTSKEHDMFDTTEDELGQGLELDLPDPRGMRLDKRDEKNQRYNEVANKPPSKTINTLKTQSFLNKQNVKDDIQKKEKYNLEEAKYAKHPIPSVRSLKVPTEGSLSSEKSQKLKKGKVTFADTKTSQSSSFEIISAKANEGVSSSNFNPSAIDDMEMELLMENENEHEINDNDGSDFQMDENEGSMSEIEMDDNIDEFSNYTSLDVPAENRKPNNKQSNSPASSSFELDITMPSNPPKQTNNTSKPITDDFFNFMGNDMSEFFN